MKVGDVVARTKDLASLSEHTLPEEILGIVIDIHDWKTRDGAYPDELCEFQKLWIEKLGRRIDVLWADGKMTKSFAEGALRAVNECR